MTLTLPSDFDMLRLRGNSGACFIFEIDIKASGVGTPEYIYLARKAIDLSNSLIRVDGLVLSSSAIHRSVDPLGARYQPANLTLEVSAGPSKKKPDDYIWLRSADELYKSIGRIANVYWYPGGNETALNDCLLLMKATVTDVQYKSDAVLTVSMDERITIGHRSLPQRLVEIADFPNAPEGVLNRAAPLIYGDVTESEYHPQTGLALAEAIGVPSGGALQWKWLAADHPVASLGPAWFFIAPVNAWAETTSGLTYNTDEDGRATFSISDSTAVQLDVFLYPTSTTGRVTDHDETTYGDIIADSTTTGHIDLLFEQVGSGINEIIQNEVAEITQFASVGNVRFEYKLEIPDGVTISQTSFQVRYGYTGGSDDWSASENMTTDTEGNGILRGLHFAALPYNWTDANDGVFWHPGTGSVDSTQTQPFILRINLTGSGFVATDVIGFLYEARLQIICRMSRVYEEPEGVRQRRLGSLGRLLPEIYTFGSRETPTLDRVAIECGGRAFGAWIDAGGRSNPYDEDDAIVDAPYIVESLIRDELGVATADIDAASFDAEYSDMAGFRDAILTLNADKSGDSQAIIERLCREHLMMLVVRPNGQLRLLNWAVGQGVLAATLTFDDLVDPPDVWLTSVTDVWNDVLMHYSYNMLTGNAGKQKRYQHAGSITRFGGPTAMNRSRDIILRSTRSTTIVDKIAELLITDGYMSGVRVGVTFKTPGMKFAFLEIGDLINFDAASLDPVKLVFGHSWGDDSTFGSDSPFMITGIRTSEDGIRIDAENSVPFLIA